MRMNDTRVVGPGPFYCAHSRRAMTFSADGSNGVARGLCDIAHEHISIIADRHICTVVTDNSGRIAVETKHAIIFAAF